MRKKQRLIILLMALMVLTTSAEAQTIVSWKVKDLQTAMDTATAPTIINFWATFCKPCIEELPHFQTLAKQYRSRGLKLILVSLDLKEAYPKAVQAFVKNRGLTAPVVYLDESNADNFVPLVDSAWSGAIPASLFINRQIGYRKFVEEELSKEKLEAEIRLMLGELGKEKGKSVSKR